MGNNHGMTRGFIARSEQDRLGQLDWRWWAAKKELLKIDPEFATWYGENTDHVRHEMITLMEARISELKSHIRIEVKK
jgi:hypothetical protein